MTSDDGSDKTPDELPRATEREVGTLNQMLHFADTGEKTWLDPEPFDEDWQDQFLQTFATVPEFRDAFVVLFRRASE
jgi:hypothetical protein